MAKCLEEKGETGVRQVRGKSKVRGDARRGLNKKIREGSKTTGKDGGRKENGERKREDGLRGEGKV